MFKLEITKLDDSIENIYNMNKKEDDFLRFVPKQFGVTSDKIKVFYMGDFKDECEAYLNLSKDNFLDIGEMEIEFQLTCL